MAIKRGDFPLPDLNDVRTAPFFTAAGLGELRIPRCETCARLVWYPADACPRCEATDMPWSRVSGLGTLYSWAVVRRAFLPAFADMVPFVTGIVALDDDPAIRVVTLVVDVEVDDGAALYADAPMQVVFRPLAFPTVPATAVIVPMFAPA